MILTYKLRHGRDFTDELQKAFAVAEFAVITRSRTSKDVAPIGLKSVIANQVLKKYGRQKNLKKIRHVNLIVPNQGIKVDRDARSIWVPCLKLRLPYPFPDRFTKINQIEVNKEFAFVSCTIPDASVDPPTCFIGVDRNTTGHIAVAANPDTGKVIKLGKAALHIHKKYAAIRTRLQKQGKYRVVKRIKNHENRIVKNPNHHVSTCLVSGAKGLHAALVFEDLSGIRQTKKQYRSFNYALHSRSFYQLQQFVAYKAKLLGVPVLYVDPAYTSQDCSRCGARGNRLRKGFTCPVCGHVDHADANAAFNIALRQKSRVDRIQTGMYTMGALIPHDALFECGATSEPHVL